MSNLRCKKCEDGACSACRKKKWNEPYNFARIIYEVGQMESDEWEEFERCETCALYLCMCNEADYMPDIITVKCVACGREFETIDDGDPHPHCGCYEFALEEMPF